MVGLRTFGNLFSRKFDIGSSCALNILSGREVNAERSPLPSFPILTVLTDLSEK